MLVREMRDKRQALDQAKSHEAGGRADEAARAYLSAGSLSDAVRVLVEAKRYLDAGNLVMRAVGAKPDQVSRLQQGQKRRLAHRAALYYVSAGKLDVAMTILEGLGDQATLAKVRQRAAMSAPPPASEPPARLSDPGMRPMTPPPRASPPPSASSNPPAPAAGPKSHPPVNQLELARRLEGQGQLALAKQAYVRLKRFADAGRVAEKTGDHEEAAIYYTDGGRFLEAARAQLALGETGNALQLLVRVAPDSPEYRRVCGSAIALATKLDALDFDLDRFLQRYVRTGVASKEELESFYRLAKLYERHDFATSARQVYEQIEAFDPEYEDVAQRLQAMSADHNSSKMVFEKIVREDTAFANAGGQRRRRLLSASGLGELPELPDLPDLPDLPPVSRPARAETPPHPSEASTAPPPPPIEETILVEPGAIVANRYEVVRPIGEGGMAEVFEVHDKELDIRIALKLFNADAESEVLLQRFKRELMLARELSHHNIVRVYDIGVHQGRRFITMEMLEGIDLRDLMDEKPLTWGKSLEYLVQACAGLHAAHERGVVHRDIKPENFFVTEDDVIKVMDFGIAKKATATSNITQEGFTAGTPAYMSPDQIRDFGNVTPVSDVYAMGVIAFELLTGDLPFYHDAAMSLMMMHLNDEPPAPTLLEPDLPTELEEIILHALEKDPKKRIQSCEELGKQLQKVLDEMS